MGIKADWENGGKRGEKKSINQSIYLANCATTKMNVNKTM